MNIYETVTKRIVGALERGTIPWRCPWRAEAPRNLITGRRYRGVNVLLLQSSGFRSPYWITFCQTRRLKGFVRKGEKSTPVVFFQRAADGDELVREKKRGFFRYFSIFNVEQCEGLAIPPPAAAAPFNAITKCEEIVRGFGDRPRIDHGGCRACYIPADDLIQMPERESFASAPEYYSTLFHELTHATGAFDRLNRRTVTDPISFASHAYSIEELTAEIGASFLCAEGGILNRTLDNSAAYIRHWSRKLNREPTWIVNASSAASKAATYILGRQAADAGDESSVAA
jgi:antirestriction protein ArdC